eukprot:3327758-Rhodomonas_salina.4
MVPHCRVWDGVVETPAMQGKNVGSAWSCKGSGHQQPKTMCSYNKMHAGQRKRGLRQRSLSVALHCLAVLQFCQATAFCTRNSLGLAGSSELFVPRSCRFVFEEDGQHVCTIPTPSRQSIRTIKLLRDCCCQNLESTEADIGCSWQIRDAGCQPRCNRQGDTIRVLETCTAVVSQPPFKKTGLGGPANSVVYARTGILIRTLENRSKL